MGIDTLKLAYDLRAVADPYDSGWGDTSVLCEGLLSRRGLKGVSATGWKLGNRYGSTGPVRWHEWIHADEGVRVTVKGVAGRPTMLWEGSVPKFLGVQGVAEPETARIVDRFLRSLVPGLGQPRVRRLDVTQDLVDWDGVIRRSAKGWNPHARSRYVQADYQDGETFFLFNKSRAVRVYDKFAEDGEPWAEGLTRVEYQMHGDWCGKMGCGHLHSRFCDHARLALEPLVSDLLARVPDVSKFEQRDAHREIQALGGRRADRVDQLGDDSTRFGD